MRTAFSLRALGLAAAVALVCSSPAKAQEMLTLMVGPPEGVHAEITFSPDTPSDRAIMIATHLAGVGGSRLALKVDRATQPAYEHILAEGECKFVDAASACEVAIAGNSPTYRTLVDLFKRGLVVHIEVETAGSMEMAQDASLRGFTKAYKGL